MASDEAARAVVAPIEAYIHGLNAHDLDAVVGIFADDASLMANESATASGRTEIRAAYAHRFTIFDYGRILHVDDWSADGDLAVVRCHTTGSLTLKATDTTIDAVSRELFALKRVDGEWRIYCYMFNRATPA